MIMWVGVDSVNRGMYSSAVRVFVILLSLATATSGKWAEEKRAARSLLTSYPAAKTAVERCIHAAESYIAAPDKDPERERARLEFAGGLDLLGQHSAYFLSREGGLGTLAQEIVGTEELIRRIQKMPATLPNRSALAGTIAEAYYNAGHYQKAAHAARVILASNPNDKAAHALLKLSEGRGQNYAPSTIEQKREIGAAPIHKNNKSTPAQKISRTTATPIDPFVSNDPLRKRYLAELDARLVTTGISREAEAYARSLFRAMLSQTDPRALEGMLNNNTYLFIIPKGKKLVDLPEFAQLKGKRASDGRLYDNLGGVANVLFMNGKGRATAIDEENLVGQAPIAAGYPKGFVLIHELAHAIHFALPDTGLRHFKERIHGAKKEVMLKMKQESQASSRIQLANPFLWLFVGGRASMNGYNEKSTSFKDVEKAYKMVRRRPGRTRLGHYADSNEFEAFGQATAAYFGKGQFGEDSNFVRNNYPEMYDVLRKIFGPGDRYKK